MRSNLTDIEVMIHHWTEKAVLVSADGDRKSAVWIPKGQCEFEGVLIEGQAQIVTLPQSLAEEKGLV